MRAGEKGPLQFQAIHCRVQTRASNRRSGPEERLVVIRTLEKEPRVSYAFSNAREEEPLSELVRAHAERHRIEEMFEEGNGEVGLDHYEVRSWVGWHHHMTLSLLALWFLVLQKRQGGKSPAITVPQTREIFSRLLRRPAPTPAQIAEEVTRVLQRNEESRIYAWHTATGIFPPRRAAYKDTG